MVLKKDNMKKTLFIIGLLGTIISGLSSCEKRDYNLGYSVQDTVKAYGLTSAKAVDMMLIYKGGIQRPDWNEAEFKPYITYKDPETNAEDWLFDGFLFLEFADGAGRNYTAPVKDDPNGKATRKCLKDCGLAFRPSKSKKGSLCGS